MCHVILVLWLVNAGMSPRNHRFPVSCARQDMNMGRVSVFLINVFNSDNWGCAAATLLNFYLQLMCWKKDDITCCCIRTGNIQVSKQRWTRCKPHTEHFQIYHYKIKGKNQDFLASSVKSKSSQQSQVNISSSDVPQCHCRLLLAHFCIFGIVQGWPSSSPALATVQDVLHCWDLNCNHQLADNHCWWDYMCWGLRQCSGWKWSHLSGV